MVSKKLGLSCAKISQKFFKEVSSAPHLTSLPPGANLSDQVEMWSSQLNTFEASLQGYDDLLNQMGSGSEAEQES